MGRGFVSDIIALFLPARPKDAWRWITVRDGVITSRGDGLPDRDPPPETTTVAIAPADAVALHWADLPDRSLAQATAAARLLVSEASVTPLGDLHVAVGQEEGLSERPVGAVAAAQMTDWLAMLAESGFEPTSLVPSPMLLPRPAEGYVIGDLGGGRVVRGASSGFADEDGLTALIVGDSPVEALDRDTMEAAIVAALADPPLNLRQGAFALRKRAAIDWLLVRRLAWLIVAIMTATLLITLVQIVQYNASAASLEAQADMLAREGLARGETVNDAGQQLTDRLSRLRGGGVGFSLTAASVAAAVAAVPGAEIAGLSFDPSGKLRVTLATQTQGQIVDVQARLAAAGFSAEPSTFTGGGRALHRRADGGAAMIVRFRTWFDGRSRREKWMILVMLALFGVTIAWGIIRPIDEALSSARRANADAAVRLAQTRAQVDAVKALRRARPEAPTTPLDTLVRESASAAGFALDSVAADGGKLRVHLNSARGGALLAWLGGLEDQGVIVDQLNVTDGGNHNVAADITFRKMAS